MRHQAEVGTVTHEDGHIEFRRGNDGWRVRLDTLCVIGEFTDASGPWGDDFCMVFVEQGSGAWYVLPYDADGCADVVKAVAGRLNTQLATQFAKSTEFRSRVLWPEHLRDKPLLSDAAADGLLGRIGLRRTEKLLPEIFDFAKRVAG